MSNGGLAAGLLVMFCVSLIFSSLAITWFLFNIYGASVAGISIPEFSKSKSIDFMTSNDTEDVYIDKGGWAYSAGVGRTADTADSKIIFDNLGYSTGTTYVNEYDIDNKGNDYGIILNYNSQNTLEVVTKSDELCVHNSFNVLGVQVFPDKCYSLSGANQYSNPHIKAEYTVLTSAQYPTRIAYYINGQQIINAPSLDVPGNLNVLPIKQYYGGVHAINSGLVLKSFSNPVSNSSNDALDLFSQIVSFFWALVQITVWNIDTKYLPWELNIALIKTQELGIAICLLIVGRS